MTAKLHKTSPGSQTDAPPRRQAMKQGDFALSPNSDRTFLAIHERVLATLNQQQLS